MLAERIAAWEEALPPYLHLAYLPSPDKVRLRLSAYEVEGAAVAHEIEAQFDKLYAIIPQYILGYETVTIQSVVHDLLTQRHLTLATAESCTGGAIAARFTALPGASNYFKCGWVTYSVEAKHAQLGVRLEDVARYDVVSEEVARAMAEGARQRAQVDYAVATTGIAGPTGGTAERPVNFVFHGGSGSTAQEIKDSVSYGVVKMNIDTDTQWATWEGVLNYYKANEAYLQGQLGNPKGEDQPNKKYYDPRVWLRAGQTSMIARLEKAFQELNAIDVL